MHFLKVGSAVLGFACSGVYSAALANEAPTKMSQQMEDAVIRALVKTKLASGGTTLPSDPSVPSEPIQEPLVPVVDAMGFTESDVQLGGTVKVRLNNMTVMLAELSSNVTGLRNQLEQIDQERKRDANFFVTRMNALGAQIHDLKALTMTTEIMNQEFLDPSPLTEDELRANIQKRTEGTLDALPKLTPLPPLYKCSCEGCPCGNSELENKICQCCGNDNCPCFSKDPAVPPTEEETPNPAPGGDDPIDQPAGDGDNLDPDDEFTPLPDDGLEGLSLFPEDENRP